MKNEAVFSHTQDRLWFHSEWHVNVECVLHLHATMELVLVTDGTLHMTVAGREYDIEAGYGIFVPPFETHSFHSASPNRCHVLEFSCELVSYFFDFLREHMPTTHLFSVGEESARLAQTLLPTGQKIDAVRAAAVVAPLCYDVLCGCAFEERREPLDDTVATILEYVNRHFDEDMGLESVARAVGVHPVTISKIFAKQAGVGFSHYLQYVRCTHAAQLIKTSKQSFAEIAYESGFGSIRSFNRAFQSVYRVTPTEYKKTFGGI